MSAGKQNMEWKNGETNDGKKDKYCNDNTLNK